MRVLQVHNFYRSGTPSGENRVVERESALLAQAGHEVQLFSRHNDEFEQRPFAIGAEASLLEPWNYWEHARFLQRVAGWRPDVVHFHNTFPLITAAAVHAARDAQLPRVWTVHNYRPWCASADTFRDGRTCTLCLDQSSVLPALRYGCYRNSRSLTFPVAMSIALHRRRQTWTRGFHKVITLSRFQAERVAALGIPEERLTVVPHCTEDRGFLPWEQRERAIVYLGRLAPEKGVTTLLEAYAKLHRPRPRLEIAGDGPLRSQLEETCRSQSLGADVRFHGVLSSSDARSLLARSRLFVMPSEWRETFGLGIIEAFSHGVPVIASRIAGLSELVESGVTGHLFTPGDVGNLAQVLATTTADEAKLRAMAGNARATYEEHYSTAAGLRRLEAVYSEAIKVASTDAA